MAQGTQPRDGVGGARARGVGDGNQAGDGPAAAADHQFLPLLHPVEQRGEIGLGLEGADIVHGRDPYWFTQLVYHHVTHPSSTTSPALVPQHRFPCAQGNPRDRMPAGAVSHTLDDE